MTASFYSIARLFPGAGLIQGGEGVGVEFEFGSLEHLAGLLDAGGAGDRRGDTGALDDPGQSDLRRCCSMRFGDALYRIQDGETAIIHVRLLHATSTRTARH